MWDEIYELARASGLPDDVAQRVADHCVAEPTASTKAVIQEAREVADLCKHTGYATAVAAMFVGAGYTRRQAQQAMQNHQAAGRSYDLGIALIGRRMY